MYDYKYIRVEQPEPGMAVMSFIRPEKLNSWSREVFNDMLHFFRLLKTDDETKVLIIRGEGDRAFCTGLSQKDYPKSNEAASLFRRNWNANGRKMQKTAHQT